MEAEATLRLKVTAGSAAGTEISVDDELLIGRDAEGAGGLSNDIEISRRHALIKRSPEDGWTIEDLGSRNGTLVNGHRLQRPRLLGVGDAIEVGATTLVVQVSAPVVAPDQGLQQIVEGLAPTVKGDVQPGPEPAAAEPPTEPTPEAEPAPPEAESRVPPRITLTLQLDLAEGEAVLSLADGSDRVRLVFEDGAWRISAEV